ncbi:MAG: DUF488 family protein [Clostridiaceae bacterium]|jgi:uncharacterized protein YeaO (DUF488 family)|nr:DUF488 family protein [Clostridiaceae bacterium]
MFRIKRIYDENVEDCEYRILVDRLWPRGISKEKAKINLWAKEIAPSNELRKWFNHDISKFELFKNKYFEELNNNEFAMQFKKEYTNHNITLLYSAKNEKYNNAIVLKEWLES